MKPCTRCTLWKPLSDYYRDRRNRDGRQSACKECERVRILARYVRKDNPLLTQPRDHGGRFAHGAKGCFTGGRA